MEAYADMTVLFENAAKMQPSNASLLREVFLCAVRQRDYLRAQQVAARLYKAEGSNAAAGRYMCCAAACSLVQARRTGSTAFLPLAERMIAKALTDRAAAAAAVAAAAEATDGGASQPARYTGEEVTLYTTLLREQGKPQEALAALERLTAASAASAVNDAVVDQSSVEQGTVVALSWAERCELEADLLQEVMLHERAAATFADLIAAHPDQWTYYMRHFDLIEVRNNAAAIATVVAAAISKQCSYSYWNFCCTHCVPVCSEECACDYLAHAVQTAATSSSTVCKQLYHLHNRSQAHTVCVLGVNRQQQTVMLARELVVLVLQQQRVQL
jgi:tetratricopeptide (TPR) repeat protein